VSKTDLSSFVAWRVIFNATEYTKEIAPKAMQASFKAVNMIEMYDKDNRAPPVIVCVSRVALVALSSFLKN
jgi:hypothetical protein